jgi:hypothetical protein
MIDEAYIRKITRLAKAMREFGESLADDDRLSLEAFDFIIAWWKARKFEDKEVDGVKIKYIKQ